MLPFTVLPARTARRVYKHHWHHFARIPQFIHLYNDMDVAVAADLNYLKICLGRSFFWLWNVWLNCWPNHRCDGRILVRSATN